MKPIDEQTKNEIKKLVYNYFSEECDIDKSAICDDTNIMEELDGDSLMLLSLLERVRTKYELTITLKALGRHLMKKPADTIGSIVDLTIAVVKHGDDIVNIDL